MQSSVQPRDRIFVKGCGYLSFAKHNKNISKNLIDKYSQKRLHHAKQSATDALLWQYYRDEPFLDANGAIVDFPVDNNNSASFKFKTRIAGRIWNNDAKDVKIMVLLKYLSKLLKYH